MKKFKRFLLLPVLLLLVCFTFAQTPAPFTPGNIVVYRIGDGSVPISSFSTLPTFLDEYTSNGILVQSIALPTVGGSGDTTHRLVNGSGMANSKLSLSANSQYIILAGIDTVGYSTSTTNTRKVIGRVKYDGTINTATSISGINTARAATSNDGTTYWMAAPDGIRYGTIGTDITSTSSTLIYSGGVPNYTYISNGQLYTTFQSLFPKFGTIGSGLPTTSGQTVSILPGDPKTGTAHQCVFLDLNPNVAGPDVFYITSDSLINGGLQKWSLVNGSWVLNGVVGTTSGATGVYRGAAAQVSGNSVTLFATVQGNNTSVAGGQIVSLVDNSGYNGPFSGTPSVLVDLNANAPNYPVNTYALRGLVLVPQPSTPKVNLKVFLQGAYSTALARHKDVTATWASVLNTNALSQPYNTAAFGNYAGTESVASGFFQSTAGTTDILDWVLLELRDQTTPSTVVARRAAFVREDGNIVDLDGASAVKFTNVASGNYYMVTRHRNHLAVRTSVILALDGNVYSSTNTTSYDCTIAQSQAYQNPAVTTNAAMVDFGGVFGMFGGNANSNTSTRASGAPTVNDYLYLVNTLLGGNTATILSNVYNSGDLNLDGTVRASGAPTVNDYLILVNTILGGNTATIYTAHQ